MSNARPDDPRTANENSVEITSTSDNKIEWTLADDATFYVKGGFTLVTKAATVDEKMSEAAKNKVNIKNLQATNVDVVGGSIATRNSDKDIYDVGEGIAKENVVDISNSEFKKLSVAGGFSVRGKAENNRVNINNITVTEAFEIVGGYVKEYGEASGNTVSISNSKLADNGKVYGSYLKESAPKQGHTDKATNNKVIIGPNVTSLDGNEAKFDIVHGGYLAQTHYCPSVFYVNTLDVSSRFTTGRLNGFQTMNFNLDPIGDLSKPIITVTDKAVKILHDKDKNSVITVTSSKEIKDKVILINSKNGFVTDLVQDNIAKPGDVSNILGDNATLKQVRSLARVETYKIDKDKLKLEIEDNKNKVTRDISADQNLVLTMKGNADKNTNTNSDTDPLMEASISTLATMYAADELFVDTLNRNINRSYDGMFVTSRGGYYSIDTRHRVEANVFNALIGYGTKALNGEIGVFTELGHSSYDTYTFDSNGQRAPDSGKHNYVGAGIFANQEILDTGIRASAYFKLGSFRNDFDTNILGTQYDFDRTSGYIGAHLGLAKDASITEKVNARFYGSYFYDAKDSETYNQDGTKGASGAKFTYDDIQSHRLQFGTMITCNVSDSFKPYASIGFEQVLDAKATGYAEDSLGKLDLHETDMEGVTGITSIGFNYVKENIELGAGIAGHFGTRNGGNAQIQAKYTF